MKTLKMSLMIYLFSTAMAFAEEAAGISWGQIIHDLSTGVLDVLIPVVVALVGYGVKKALDLIKIGFIRNWVRKWVLSAYQKYTSGQHEEKFQNVALKVHKKFPYLTVEEIKDYIEEAVKEIKIELGRKD